MLIYNFGTSSSADKTFGQHHVQRTAHRTRRRRTPRRHPRTLKYYEERGLVTPSRSEGRYRLYDENDLERFGRILRLRSLGFSLHGIVEMLKRPLEKRKPARIAIHPILWRTSARVCSSNLMLSILALSPCAAS